MLEDALRSITRVMKHLKGKPKNNVNFSRFIIPLEVIDSVLVPSVDEEPLMERIMDGEPDYENEEGVSNLWSTWLTVKEKPIFWQELYELDVAAREFPQKKEKRKVHEEASSSNTSLEDV
ncbi:hypothetical protein F2Q70_00036428 [Brassica cretica]|uniref:DUF287 domain-containing protein n=1 Tax=Brassica cretica TaxID=69181 RepID=A0A8S9JRG8_BRACR|nr:hypothetical protein F2Q70_00036428 [Brassica cretica]